MTELEQRLKNLDAHIEAEMQKWHVPGLAVAVIHNGVVIHQQGYGSRDLDNHKPVTPNTLFAIGSCTKAFTAMTLALLVEDGKLDWDTPIRQYMPQFEMHDDFASQQITARDLVCHRSGLPRHDTMWYGSSSSRWELFEGLKYLKPSAPFRYLFQYQNLMYMVAGCLVETITGQAWERFTQARIFDVLGMRDSVFSVIDAEKAPDAAMPHEIKEGACKRIPFRNIDAIAPAGAIHSNLPEMATWLMMHMQGGKYSGDQFVTEDNLKQMHSPHVTVPSHPLMDFPEIQYAVYGLGWAQQIYRGHVRIRHTGGIDGFITDVSFLPSKNLGVIVFNNGGDGLSHCVAMHIYDCLLDLEPIDWRERIEKVNNNAKAEAEEAKQKLAESRKPNTSPSHPLNAYGGDYEHPGYGVLRVSLNGDGLQAVYNSHEFKLSHFHYDIFESTHDLGEDTHPMPFAFRCNLQGDVAEVAIKLEPAVDEIIFLRKQNDSQEGSSS